MGIDCIAVGSIVVDTAVADLEVAGTFAVDQGIVAGTVVVDSEIADVTVVERHYIVALPEIGYFRLQEIRNLRKILFLVLSVDHNLYNSYSYPHFIKFKKSVLSLLMDLYKHIIIIYINGSTKLIYLLL